MTVAARGVDHLVACQRNDGRGWANLYRLDGVWHEHSTRANALARPAIDTLLEGLKAHPDADATFTSRSVEELVAEPVIEWPDGLRSYVPGGSIVALLPERDVGADLWSQVWRDPRMALHGGGKDVKFRLPDLPNQIEAYLVREGGTKSFEPISRSHAQPNVPPMNRPSGFARELLVRRTWCLASILPEAVPKPFVHRWTREEEIEMEGKKRAMLSTRKARAKVEEQFRDDARVAEHNMRLRARRGVEPPTFSADDLRVFKD